MNDHLKRTCSFVIASVLAFSSILAGLPASTVYAAGDTYAEAQISNNTERVNEVAVKEALDSICKARSTGSREDYIKARNLIALLRPIDRLRLYAYLVRDYYLRNYRNAGFRYFNAEKYLAEYEDVRLDALRYSPDDIFSYALEHYLERGITEGRSSGTGFDPAVFILVRPEVLFDVIVASDDTISDTLYESFIRKTGKTSTESYTVLTGSLTVIEKADAGGIAPAPSVLPSSSDDTSDHEDGSSDSHASGGESSHQEDYRERTFINNLARDITPYSLYMDGSFDTEDFYFITDNPFKAENSNMNVDIRFLGENYRRAKELSANKKYTLMLYHCGTDLENNGDYRLLSGEIVSMLQADIDNVNVILCVGGTESYGNDYLNDREHGASGMRAGIYYLNPDGLSEIAKNNIRDIRIDCGDDVIYQLSDRPEDYTHGTSLTHGLHFSDIITEDTLVQLVSTSAVDMADPSFLAGFINLSTNLFPADNYGLTLSNHGGGLEGGVIFTEGNAQVQSNSISVQALESALASTDLYKDRDVSPDGKLGLIFYSACTMGSTELAYLTKDYYRYMIASEEITAGYDPYRDILNGLDYDVENGASDCSIAKGFMNKYETCCSSHHGVNDYYVGSIATYSSEHMDDMYEKINSLAAQLSEILGTDSSCSYDMKNDVFTAIRKAALSCYPTCNSDPSRMYYMNMKSTSYVDIGELLTHLHNNLETVSQNRYGAYDPSDKEEFDELMDRLSETLDTGFLVSLSIYNKEMGGISAVGTNNAVIPLNYTMNTQENIWTDIRSGNGPRDYLYGSSIYLPLLKGTEYFNEEYSEYYKYFKDSDLNDYVNFVQDYLTYLNDESGSGYKTRTDVLFAELSDIRLYDLITQVEDNGNVIRTLTDDQGHSRQYISFKIPDSYEEGSAPAHSLGSPMLDILETQPIITVAALHKQKFGAQKDNQPGYMEVSMICAEEAVPSFSFALDSNTISFDVTDPSRSIIAGMTMEGKRLGYTGDDIEWQFVLRSDKDCYDEDKLEILQAVFPDVQGLTDVNAITISGKYKPEQGDDAECYHVFKVTDDDKNQYSYQGSVETVQYGEGNSGYHKAENVIAVSAYHYVLKEERDEYGNVKYTKATLEDLSGVEDGFFDIRDLVLKTGIGVAQAEFVNGRWVFNGEATAYCIDPSGREEYSDIGYVSEHKYNTGNINTGNGPLGNVEFDDDEMAGIGTFGTEGPDGDTERSDDSGNDELPIRTVGTNVSEPSGDDPASAEEDITASEVAPSVAEAPVVVEAPIENSIQNDTVEPALVEPRREETESDEPSPDGDHDSGDDGDDGDDGDGDNDNSDSVEADSGSCDQED